MRCSIFMSYLLCTVRMAYSLEKQHIFKNANEDYFHSLKERNFTCKAKKIESSTYTPLENSTLVFVQVLTRHGARTPIYLIQNEENDWYNCSYLKEYSAIENKNNSSQNEIRINKNYLIPKKNKHNLSRFYWEGNCALGQLTDLGKSQLKDLGKSLRNVYAEKLNFIDLKLNVSSQIKLRSIDLQ
ncbi:Counting factor 60 [Smittium culicis]|uniref:Counting factor 60 n=1 Tax=Smittium culicis TaxID=133412 RepID=A0A1R1YCR0_9FUNG|nr:Counting factor 60 [Smittium culicis]